MPCPLFEPREKLAASSEFTLRFPLIAEFTGICHAGANPVSQQLCNHGYARQACPSFPALHQVSAVRFHVTATSGSRLTVLVIEEQDHWPRLWQSFEYSPDGERIEPEISDVCRRAQLLRFCKTYLETFTKL